MGQEYVEPDRVQELKSLIVAGREIMERLGLGSEYSLCSGLLNKIIITESQDPAQSRLNEEVFYELLAEFTHIIKNVTYNEAAKMLYDARHKSIGARSLYELAEVEIGNIKSSRDYICNKTEQYVYSLAPQIEEYAQKTYNKIIEGMGKCFDKLWKDNNLPSYLNQGDIKQSATKVCGMVIEHVKAEGYEWANYVLKDIIFRGYSEIIKLCEYDIKNLCTSFENINRYVNKALISYDEYYRGAEVSCKFGDIAGKIGAPNLPEDVKHRLVMAISLRPIVVYSYSGPVLDLTKLGAMSSSSFRKIFLERVTDYLHHSFLSEVYKIDKEIIDILDEHCKSICEILYDISGMAKKMYINIAEVKENIEAKLTNIIDCDNRLREVYEAIISS